MSQPTAEQTIVPSLDERFIVLVTSVGHALCHIAELIFAGAMLAIMAQFSLAPDEATALWLLGLILMGAGALPTGYLTDRLGTRRLLMIYFVGTGLSALAVAASTGPLFLFLGVTALGAAISIYHPAGVAMISLGVSAKGRAMGIHGVAGSIGVAIGPFLGYQFASWGMWRAAYLVVAGLAAGGALLLALAPRRVPSDADAPLVPGAVLAGPEPTAEPLRKGRLEQPISFSTRNRPCPAWRGYVPLALLLVVMMLGGLNYRSLMTALPAFLSTSGASAGLNIGGLMILFSLVVGGFGQYFGGVLGDRIGSRPVYLGCVLLLAACALVMSTLEGSLLALPVACLIAVFLFGQQPVENTLLAEATSQERRGMSYGMKFALTFGIGALGAQLVGFIWSETGQLGPAFHVITAGALLMALCLVLFGRLTAREAQPAAGPEPVEEQPWPADSSQPSPVS